MAEDSGIFLISGRIGGNFAKLEVILGVSGLENHDTVFGVQTLLHGIQGALCETFLDADACQYAEALRLNVNLTLAAFLGANLVAVCIVCAEEPLAVPAVCEDGIIHSGNLVPCSCRLVLVA